MLKSILYFLLLLTTTARFGDMVYLLTKDSTNLPVPVIVLTTAMILYGIGLVFYKFVAPIRMKQLVTFYIVQTAMIAFNLFYVAAFCPLQMSGAEILIVGSFLDLVVNVGLIYASRKKMRNLITMPVAERGYNV